MQRATAMKNLFKIIFIAFCANVSGQELQPIKNILESGIASGDNAKISYVLKRCVTLNLVMGNWMQEKGGEPLKKSVDNFFNQALLLKQLSFDIENDIEKQRKIKLSSVAELEKSLLLNIKLISPLYVERLTKNYAVNGSYFENDAQLKDEILICSDFSKHLNTLK